MIMDKIIFEYIENHSQILDVGCGDASLLYALAKEKECEVQGIDIHLPNVIEGIRKGISVIHIDATEFLYKIYKNKFDYIILNNVLSTTTSPKEILYQAGHIASKIIVSIPNFGYIENRMLLLLKGRMPVSRILSYEWYNTPNIHFSTIKDFRDMISTLNYTIEKEIYLNSSLKNSRIYILPNLFATHAVFVLRY